ncbi:MAG: hypothetical protein PWR12_1209, partial [Eubacteriaceae bacterium]|nr:hypothetical protein [Eubacteriaceae bacterium]
MNKKENILDAWITIEQLSEGSINKKDKNLEVLDTETDDFKMQFSDLLNVQKAKQQISDEKFKKSGLVLYFDIFDFQEIINILRDKYNIPATYEETSNSDKFTFSLYFDNQLNFLADKLFFTISGYIKHNGKLPNDFLKEETIFRDELSKKFEYEEFNAVIADLFQKYKTSQEFCRYKFVSNLDNDDVSLHSFFIDDLQKAKKIKTDNLSRYFGGVSDQRQNLDSKKDSPNFNPQVFEDILQPRFYPLGRFPTNPDYALSFMQQVAVNLALNDRNDIRSVNGPPGTGKTTLLKDVFADLIVQQAVLICQLPEKEIKGSLIYYKNGKLGFLPSHISDKGIVVASSNNGAVLIIVNVLPLKEGIAEEF